MRPPLRLALGLDQGWGPLWKLERLESVLPRIRQKIAGIAVQPAAEMAAALETVSDNRAAIAGSQEMLVYK